MSLKCGCLHVLSTIRDVNYTEDVHVVYLTVQAICICIYSVFGCRAKIQAIKLPTNPLHFPLFLIMNMLMVGGKVINCQYKYICQLEILAN